MILGTTTAVNKMGESLQEALEWLEYLSPKPVEPENLSEEAREQLADFDEMDDIVEEGDVSNE